MILYNNTYYSFKDHSLCEDVNNANNMQYVEKIKKSLENFKKTKTQNQAEDPFYKCM